MNVICVIGDMVQSRLAPDRQALQERFQGVLQAVNARGGDGRLSPCTITLGDEFQAVYRDPAGLFRDLVAIQGGMLPMAMRFAIGIGPLATALNPEQAIGMDGPAFHLAREVMGRELKPGPRRFAVLDVGRSRPGWVGPGLDLVSHLASGWRANRFQVLEAMMAGTPVRDMATQLGVSPSAIYKNIHDGALVPVEGMLRAVAAWMEEGLVP